MRFVGVLLVALFSILLTPAIHFAADSALLKSVEFRVDGKDRDAILFTLNGKYLPKIFKLEGDKPRLVIDFQETAYRGATSVAAAGGIYTRGIRVGIHNKPHKKTRVVIDLVKELPLEWQQEFNQEQNLLVITISGATGEKVEISAKRTKIKVEKTVLLSATKIKAPIAKEGGGTLPPGPVLEQPVNSAGNADVPPLPTEPAEQVLTAQQLSPPEKSEPETSEPVVETEAAKSSLDDAEFEFGSTLEPALLNVTFESSAKGEMVVFHLDDFHPPVVSAIESESPRVICDFYNMVMDDKVPAVVETTGEWVRGVRVGRHVKPDKIRAVLDLAPGNNYDLQQVFFNQDNSFILIVNPFTPPGR